MLHDRDSEVKPGRPPGGRQDRQVSEGPNLPGEPTGLATDAPDPAAPALTRRRPRTLAHELVAVLGERIRDGRLAPGDKLPTEAAIMAESGVSRTVVREAISRLQAAGLVETRHGIGTFVIGPGDGTAFRITPEQLATLRDVIAVLELRIGIETEAAGLAAQRRTDDNLQRMRAALAAFGAAIEAGQSAVAADFQFHHEIAKATQNVHFGDLLGTLGMQIIPRARLEPAEALSPERLAYLRRVHGEHESICDAIAAGDAEAARAAMRTHLSNSRERRRRAASVAA
jgi:DNA-binding FadR family transcriptional regulator